MSHHQLKSLQTRLQAAVAEHEAANAIAKDANRRASELNKRVEGLRKEIAAFEAAKADPIVSEHAMLRFLERAYGIDLDQVRETILTEGLVSAINHFRTGTFPIDGYDCQAVVRDRTVITVKS